MVPFETFIEKDLNIQGERYTCSCAFVMKNTPWNINFTQTWWDLGHTGCCNHGDYDQNVFIYLIASALQPYTNKSIVPRLANVITSKTAALSEYQSHPNIHFVQEHTTIESSLRQIPIVQLHSCLKSWPGCPTAPSLIYHSGSQYYIHIALLALNNARKWIYFMKRELMK